MLAPHWLDAVFADPAKAKELFVANQRFEEAITKAQEAYAAMHGVLGMIPELYGPSPAQAARQAFLREINR